MYFLRRGVVSTSPNPQDGGSPLVGCKRLFIQFIHSYHPYRRPFLHPQPEDAPCRGDRDTHSWKEGTNAMNCCICITLLYVAVSWTLRKIGQKYLGSLCLRFWRRMEIIRWTDRVENKEVTYRVTGFGSLEVACWPLVPKFAGSHPAEAVRFLGRKNPQHAFLRRESKAVGPMSYLYVM
jgi:hypothetical protein